MKDEMHIRVEGLHPERLIRRLVDSGACFKRIRRTDARTLVFECDQENGQALLNLCERFSISAKVVIKKGKPAFMELLKNRITLLVGLAVCMGFCWFFLGRIWFIDIAFTGSASEKGDPVPFESALKSMDIHPGISDNLDTQLISRILESSIPGYGFISARIQGIRLLIEAAPETTPPQIYDLEYARDLYASIGGIVASVNVHSGVACVQPGDIVVKGQLLIRGEERSTDEENRGIGAKGEVIVRTWFSGMAESALHETVLRGTGNSSTSSRMRLFNLSLPITTGKSYAREITQTEHLPIGGLFLPLEIIRQTHHEASEVRLERDIESLSSALVTLSLSDAAANLSMNGPDEYEISRSWINFERSDSDILSANAVYEIYTDAAAIRGALSE